MKTKQNHSEVKQYSQMERRKNRGAILISRCIVDHPILGAHNPYHLAAALLILTQTAHAKWDRVIGDHTYPLEVGEVIMPRLYLAKKLQISEKKARQILGDLLKEGFIAKVAPKTGPQISAEKGRKKGRKYGTLSVSNYSLYQSFETYTGPQIGPQIISEKGLLVTNSSSITNYSVTKERNPLTPFEGKGDEIAVMKKDEEPDVVAHAVAEPPVEQAKAEKPKRKRAPKPPVDLNMMPELPEAFELYNATAIKNNGAKASVFTENRIKKMAERLKEGGLDGLKAALAEYARNDFYAGRRPGQNGTKFKMDIDFFLRPDKFWTLADRGLAAGARPVSDADRKARDAKMREDMRYADERMGGRR